MKIVIADDSYLMRDRIRNIIKTNPKVIIAGEAVNGVDALELTVKINPDLLILDIKMPGMNGIEVLKRIRGMKLKICVCILTNYPYRQYRDLCVNAGVDYFLSKSVNFDDIEMIINEIAGKVN